MLAQLLCDMPIEQSHRLTERDVVHFVTGLLYVLCYVFLFHSWMSELSWLLTDLGPFCTDKIFQKKMWKFFTFILN